MANKQSYTIKINERITCDSCKGQGEILSPRSTIKYEDSILVYQCDVCDGKGYSVKERSISIESLKELLN